MLLFLNPLTLTIFFLLFWPNHKFNTLTVITKIIFKRQIHHNEVLVSCSWATQRTNRPLLCCGGARWKNTFKFQLILIKTASEKVSDLDLPKLDPPTSLGYNLRVILGFAKDSHDIPLCEKIVKLHRPGLPTHDRSIGKNRRNARSFEVAYIIG